MKSQLVLLHCLRWIGIFGTFLFGLVSIGPLMNLSFNDAQILFLGIAIGSAVMWRVAGQKLKYPNLTSGDPEAHEGSAPQAKANAGAKPDVATYVIALPPDEAVDSDRASRSMESRANAPVHHSLSLIVASVAFGVFIIWFVQLDSMMEVIAGLVLLGTAAFGIAVGWLVYRVLEDSSCPKWAKLTSAIILGVALFLTASLLTHSHKLIRYYDHWGSDNEE